MSELPKGWALTNAIEISEPIRGVSYKKEQVRLSPEKGFTAILRANNIQNNQLNFDDLVYAPDSNIKAEQQLKSSDIVIAMSSGSLHVVGKSAQVQQDIKASFGAFCGVLRPITEIESRYLGLFLKSNIYRHSISNLAKGSNINNLKWSHFEEIPLPLAPLPEQKRIADKLDATLARVDACRERLARVAPILKRFRQSVLAAATSGQLTEDWRDEQCNLDVDSINMELTDSSNTPVNLSSRSNLFMIKRDWTFYPVTTLSQVADSRLGKMLDKAKNSGKPTPYLGNINVRWFSFDVTNLQEIRIEEKETEELRLRKGDVLICEGGEPGRCAIWMQESSEIIFQKALHRVRPHQGVLLSSWLVYSLKFAAESKRLDEYFTGTTIKHFTGRSLAKYELPLPSFSEQIEIVRRIETLFAFADRLEARLTSATTAAERLTPSLLAKAFRGELVPQDPNDEPASELLKRLASSRDAAGKAPKAKRGRKSATA